MRLAESLQMYDPNVVHEFYANAWAREDGTQDLGSRVRGRWVPFDKESISEFLGDPLQLRRDEDCTYHQMKDQFGGFNDDYTSAKERHQSSTLEKDIGPRWSNSNNGPHKLGPANSMS